MQRRSDYKGTWNALSVTAEDALRHITGNMADPSMIQSAVRTVGWLKETVGVRADDVILEIGCGAGRTGQVLAPIAATGLAPTLAEICLVTPKDDFRDSPMSISGYDVSGIADSSVDLVYCTVVFMHLFEWERFAYIREAHRLLRPGGRVFVDNLLSARTRDGKYLNVIWLFRGQTGPHTSACCPRLKNWKLTSRARVSPVFTLA
jgi:cyclopropane fatty-acyl-phospholipid synthase-like methyltransferase